jgi:hypothetical protein
LQTSALDYSPSLLPKYLAHQKHFVCLAPVDREQHVENYKRLLKVLILLCNHENKSMSHLMTYYIDENSTHIPAIMADLSSTAADDPSFSSYRNLLVNYYLHPAAFRAVSMTRSGTVIFPEVTPREFIVIDKERLNEGRLAAMNFKSNGQLEHYILMRPVPLSDAMLYRRVQRWFWEKLSGKDRPEQTVGTLSFFSLSLRVLKKEANMEK